MRSNYEKANYCISILQVIERAVEERYPAWREETEAQHTLRLAMQVKHTVAIYCAETVDERIEQLVNATPGGN